MQLPRAALLTRHRFTRRSQSKSCFIHRRRARIGHGASNGTDPAPVIPRCAIAHRRMTGVIVDRRTTTQKPAAHGCGRVLGETNHFEQNTMVDRTSQADFEFFIHRLCQDDSTSVRKEGEPHVHMISLARERDPLHVSSIAAGAMSPVKRGGGLT